ncbi:hypothetical protein [Pantoea sp. Cy-639]|uniref:hypothetical protein n=1 Tax=Pantoea sp. Cy-639 TaxID=2608360 RepID=UPI001424640A|nr:hypothetical protein [Pantoea sp. Cy-639]NIF15647.1 hypothetical protein [Pantoea sp. Cy-639]
MSVFDELNAQYAKFDAAINLQCHLLVKSIGELAIGFEKYLELPHIHWFQEGGKRGDRYVRLGTGTPKTFKEQAWPTYTALDGVVSFSLALTLTDSESGSPRFHFVFEGTVQFGQDGYEYRFNGLEAPVILSAVEVESGDFKKVCDELVFLLKSRINPESILIKKGN